MVIYSLTTFLEGTGSSNAPTLEIDYTYDDYTSQGLHSGYHNLISRRMIPSNAPTVTDQWNYTTNDQTVSGTVYYTVNKVTHSEIDDAGGHTWACQDTTYDEGVASGVPVPDAGLPTTVKAYSTCGNSSTAIKTYMGYDAYGNPVENVDGVGAANSGLYSSSGCTLSTAPVYKPPSSVWSPTRYTNCTVSDSYHAQPSSLTNALGQTGSLAYDYTQGSLPISATDPNSQVTTTSYSYDSSGNRTVSVKAPLESGSYTAQSSTFSTCTSSSTLPCYEIDSKSAQYPNATTRTFYDSLGRAVETRSTGPDAGHDTVVFTAYCHLENYDLVAADEAAAAIIPGPEVAMTPNTERCRWCDRPLFALFDIDLRDSCMAFLGMAGERLRIVTCPDCAYQMVAYVFTDVAGDGTAHWSEVNGDPPEGLELDEEGLSLPSHWYVLGSKRKTPYEGTGSHIGGYPDWVQWAQYPRCPTCGQTMMCIGQLEPQADYLEGIVYAFLCVPCGKATTVYQQT